MKIYRKEDAAPNEQISCNMYLEGKSQIVQYESLNDLISDVEHNKKHSTWQPRFFESQQASWTYGSDYPDITKTMDAVNNGQVLDSTINKVDKIKIDLFNKCPELRDLERSAFQLKRKRRFAESGDELDIDRYMCADPAMWSERNLTRVKNTVRIMFTNNLSAGNGANEILSNMVTYAAIADIFESAGISTEILCGSIVSFNINSPKVAEFMTTYKAKGSNEPLDISRMLAHGIPGVSRHFAFYVYSNLVPGMNLSTLGYPIKKAPNNRQQAMLDFLGIDLLISGHDLGEGFRMILDKVKVNLGI